MTYHRIALILEFAGGLALCRSTWQPKEWHRVLRVLEPIDARILVLRYMHGLDMVEIGDRLAFSRARVWMRLQRIHQKLRPLLERETVAA